MPTLTAIAAAGSCRQGRRRPPPPPPSHTPSGACRRHNNMVLTTIVILIIMCVPLSLFSFCCKLHRGAATLSPCASSGLTAFKNVCVCVCVCVCGPYRKSSTRPPAPRFPLRSCPLALLLSPLQTLRWEFILKK